ncbi:MAG: hypothetical protein ACR2JB_29755 [Bryobacteraceae bacterium]
MRRLVVTLLGLLSGCAGGFSQDPSSGTTIKPGLGVDIPTLKLVQQQDWSVNKHGSGSGFVKHLTLESFGYGVSPPGQGFEFPLRLTDGAFASHGLECPFCLTRPTSDRARYTLPPFGAQATLSTLHDRAELFTEFGGANAWKPDNTLIQPNRRGPSFNDAWLVQGVGAGRLAVDRNRRLWLGAAGRYLENFGEGKKHWNSFGGSATFQFAH